MVKEIIDDVESTVEDDTQYPPKKVVIPAILAIALAIFLVALVIPLTQVDQEPGLIISQDRTILGTATPAITNEFNSFGDIAWYEAGFLLPLCMLQLSFGRVYVSIT